MANLTLVDQVKLVFEDKKTKVINDLSALAFSDSEHLWCGTDEYSRIERLTLSNREKNTFNEHKVFQLQDLIEDPDFDFSNPKDEVDIEGIDYKDGYLWVIGSHSSKRKKAKKDPINDEQLVKVTKEKNRYLLARIPLDADANLVKEYQGKQIAWLRQFFLIEMLLNDRHLGKIVMSELPGKDNGFDVEGLAVKNNKVFIGLRGPVLRGIAIILEIEIPEHRGQYLQPQICKTNQQLYQKHFLDLDGLGIREICFCGDDLLIIAGPTMDLDGSIRLYQLQKPLNLPDNSLSTRENHQIEYIGEITHGVKVDRAEGLTLYPVSENQNSTSVMTVYDRPAPERIIDDYTVMADVLSW